MSVRETSDAIRPSLPCPGRECADDRSIGGGRTVRGSAWAGRPDAPTHSTVGRQWWHRRHLTPLDGGLDGRRGACGVALVVQERLLTGADVVFTFSVEMIDDA